MEAPPSASRGALLQALRTLLDVGEVEWALYLVQSKEELGEVAREARRLRLLFAALPDVSYVCPHFRQVRNTRAGLYVLCQMLRGIDFCRYYLRSLRTPFTREVEEALLEMYITMDRDAEGLSKLGLCPYFTSLLMVSKADLVIATSPHLFRERLRDPLRGFLNREGGVVVVEGARSLVDLRGSLGDSVDCEVLLHALSEARHEEGLEVEVRNLIEALDKFNGGPRAARLDKEALGLSNALLERLLMGLRRLASRVISERGAPRALASSLAGLSRLVQFLDTVLVEGLELYVQKRGHCTKLYALPQSMKAFNGLLRRLKAIVAVDLIAPSDSLMESLGVRGSLKRLEAQNFGLRDHVRENAQVILFSGASAVFRCRGEREVEAYRGLLRALYAECEEGVLLAVYPNHEIMKTVTAGLNKRMRCAVEGVRPLSYVYRSLKTDGKVLLNVSADGELLRSLNISERGKSLIKCLIFVGVPYPDINEFLPLIKGVKDEVAVECYRDYAACTVAEALKRTIRSERDRALVILADRKFLDPFLIQRLKLRIYMSTRMIDKVRAAASEFFGRIAAR